MILLKKALTASATILAGFFFVLVVLEISLRFFPVNEGMHSMPVNDSNPISRFEPNRTLIWSRYADMSMVNTVHVNNYGFVSNQDYTNKSSLPLIAVIGDSYVEALMIPYPETGHARLAAELESRIRVYSFGASGAALSQYLAYAEYAQKEFHPKKMIFVIVSTDFDESHINFRSLPGLHHFKEGDNGLTLTRTDYTPGPWVKLLRKSRLFMYLATNVQLVALPSLLSTLLPDKGNKPDSDKPTQNRVPLSKRIIDAFLDKLPSYSGLAPKDILLVVDGVRPELYTEEGLKQNNKSYFTTMRDHFIKNALARGFNLLDMQPVFIADFRLNSTKFEHSRDNHWNPYAHEVFFKSVLNSGFLDEYRQN